MPDARPRTDRKVTGGAPTVVRAAVVALATLLAGAATPLAPEQAVAASCAGGACAGPAREGGRAGAAVAAGASGAPSGGQETSVPVPLPSARLRDDGLYGSYVPGDDYTSWLRFYDDGTVLSVSSVGTAQQVARWLVKGYDGAGVGAVSRDGFIISFSTESHAGVVEYWGTVGADLLDLASVSRINGFEDRRLYRFFPIEG